MKKVPATRFRIVAALAAFLVIGSTGTGRSAREDNPSAAEATKFGTTQAVLSESPHGLVRFGSAQSNRKTDGSPASVSVSLASVAILLAAWASTRMRDLSPVAASQDRLRLLVPRAPPQGI